MSALLKSLGVHAMQAQAAELFPNVHQQLGP